MPKLLFPKSRGCCLRCVIMNLTVNLRRFVIKEMCRGKIMNYSEKLSPLIEYQTSIPEGGILGQGDRKKKEGSSH